MSVWLSIGVVLLLILLEGLFVSAELALVSLREGQVKALAENSRRGQKVARLVAAGATELGRNSFGPEFEWVTLADPDGNAFCVAGG